MKMMKHILLMMAISAATFQKAGSQGCVAIRSTGTLCTRYDAPRDNATRWQLNVGYRYFKSFRHFVGTKEQKHRVEQNTDVRNWQSTLDFNLLRHLDDRWSLAVYLPILANKRSSLYEHGGKERHTTSSSGIGDIRLSMYRWIFDPSKPRKGNIQVGLGIKLPTGNYKYEDYFHTTDTVTLLGPVDQSIQLGDGGMGLTTELNAYYHFNHRVDVYGNFFYLLNPKEQNGVSTARGGKPSASSLRYKSSTMSVPDQYMVRAGTNITFHDLTLSAGMRMECIPAEDLIGGDTGFRRPGYVIAAEPGASWQFKNFTAYATVPVAIVRSRTQSVADKIRTEITGVHAQGDAAFADYLVNVGLAVRF